MTIIIIFHHTHSNGMWILWNLQKELRCWTCLRLNISVVITKLLSSRHYRLRIPHDLSFTFTTISRRLRLYLQFANSICHFKLILIVKLLFFFKQRSYPVFSCHRFKHIVFVIIWCKFKQIFINEFHLVFYLLLKLPKLLF